MKIPMELLNKWKGLRSQGDNDEIAKFLERKMPEQSFISTVSRAFKSGRCPDYIFKALSRFYTQKETELFPPAKSTNHE